MVDEIEIAIEDGNYDQACTDKIPSLVDFTNHVIDLNHRYQEDPEALNGILTCCTELKNVLIARGKCPEEQDPPTTTTTTSTTTSTATTATTSDQCAGITNWMERFWCTYGRAPPP